MKLFTAISLSLLILISTIGISINKHYCQSTDEYVYTFFGDSDSCSCAEVVKSESCHQHSACSNEDRLKDKEGCCDDEMVYLQLDSDLFNEVADITPELDWNFITVFYHTVLNDLIVLNDTPSIVNLDSYTPPIADCDFRVAFQSFLI